MVHPFGVVIDPCVGMGVKLNEGQRPVPRDMSTKSRQSRRMVAAHRDHGCTLIENSVQMRLDQARNGRRARIVEGHVAIIGDGDLLQRREPPAIGRIPCHERRRLTDRARTKTGTGPMRHRLIEGDARQRQIESSELFRQSAAQHRRHTGEDILIPQPFRIAPRNGGVHLVRGFVERH